MTEKPFRHFEESVRQHEELMDRHDEAFLGGPLIPCTCGCGCVWHKEMDFFLFKIETENEDGSITSELRNEITRDICLSYNKSKAGEGGSDGGEE